MRVEFLKMQKEHLVDLEDAVIAIKKPNGKIKLHQTFNLTESGAISGGFWGALIGLLFLNPLIGAAIGGAIGAGTGALGDAGINDEFMKALSANMQPGSSTLFVLVRKITPDKVMDEIKPYGGKVLQTSLSHNDEARLQAALDADR